MLTVTLNPVQREALSWHMSPENQDGEPFDENQKFELHVAVSPVTEQAQLCVNGAWLHSDGEWATFLEGTS